MNKRQVAEVNMFSVMVLFFAKFNSVFTGFTDLLTLISTFTTNKTLLDAEISKQTVNNTGIAVGKNAKVTLAINLLVKAARKAKVWAKQTNNTTLEKQFDVRVSEFEKMPEAVALDALVPIVTSINANITVLASKKVFPADVTAINAAIADAKNQLGTPQIAANTKVVATEKIVQLIADCKDNLDDIDDLLIAQYDDGTPANTTMIKEYLIDSEITPLGSHSTAIHATITDDAGNPLPDVLMEIVALNRSVKSDLLGIAELSKFKPNTYLVNFTHPLFQTITLTLTINRGKTLDIQIHMKK